MAKTTTDKSGSGKYSPAALNGWDYIPAGQDVVGLQVDPKRAKAAKWVKGNKKVYIVEEQLQQGSFDSTVADSFLGGDKWLVGSASA